MLKTFRNYFFPTEIDRHIRTALAFPRHAEKEITYHGFKIRMTDYLSVAYQLKEIFGEERLKFPFTGDPLIYDCGANIGISILYFKSVFPGATIHAFEPDPAVFDCLRSNVEHNQLQKIILEKKAVWIHDLGIDFGLEGADGGSVFFPGNRSKVESVRLADLLAREKNIDLLKLDIEGAEMEVLRDCQDHLFKIKFLFIEYHSWRKQEQELDELLAILRKNNFRYTIHSIGKDVLQPFCVAQSGEGMDIQLDIHAIHLGYTK
jgi:FkbM family methyltransferase